jgi:nucleotide-binding universal stress UspA family protein
VDFSEPSARAYDSAQSLARHYHAKMLLQHVVDFKLPSYVYYADAVYIAELFQAIRDGARKQLQCFAKSHARDGVQPECLVQEGGVTDSILSFAAAQKVDLLVMGTHGLKGVDRAALGSVTEKVLRKACCPVLVSRKRRDAVVAPDGTPGSIQLHKVIFCTDFSDPARRALDYALSVAAEYDAELTLLHVLEDVQTLANIREASRRGHKATRQTDSA